MEKRAEEGAKKEEELKRRRGDDSGGRGEDKGCNALPAHLGVSDGRPCVTVCNSGVIG